MTKSLPVLAVAIIGGILDELAAYFLDHKDFALNNVDWARVVGIIISGAVITAAAWLAGKRKGATGNGTQGKKV